MPVATTIVLDDALPTPVPHSFVPLGRDANGVFWFEDQSQASPVGYWKISMDFKRPTGAAPGQNSQGRVFKVNIALYEPILENVSNSTISGIEPAPTIAYIDRVNINFYMPERATLQNRKDLRKMASNLLATTEVLALVEGLQYLS